MKSRKIYLEKNQGFDCAKIAPTKICSYKLKEFERKTPECLTVRADE